MGCFSEIKSLQTFTQKGASLMEEMAMGVVSNSKGVTTDASSLG